MANEREAHAGAFGLCPYDEVVDCQLGAECSSPGRPGRRTRTSLQSDWWAYEARLVARDELTVHLDADVPAYWREPATRSGYTSRQCPLTAPPVCSHTGGPSMGRGGMAWHQFDPLTKAC